ncbi:hypothetical protein [Cupriavidus taiwanensis]|uniref:hypothetical protein n=1 Tax=Cupriavidus taiwanensis TaxID=164546 RepID=UPI000E10B237|nr:hypothetical protein [Cupriavidus taiwanensis]SPA50587.1 protein of unknown function [Cupriavidus taiwanensis]
MTDPRPVDRFVVVDPATEKVYGKPYATQGGATARANWLMGKRSNAFYRRNVTPPAPKLEIRRMRYELAETRVMKTIDAPTD